VNTPELPILKSRGSQRLGRREPSGPDRGAQPGHCTNDNGDAWANRDDCNEDDERLLLTPCKAHGYPNAEHSADDSAEPINRGTHTRTVSDPRSRGLGLSLVDNVVTSAGGTLTITPVETGGLSVRLSLPKRYAPQT
jgi:hypothetical protein